MDDNSAIVTYISALINTRQLHFSLDCLSLSLSLSLSVCLSFFLCVCVCVCVCVCECVCVWYARAWYVGDQSGPRVYWVCLRTFARPLGPSLQSQHHVPLSTYHYYLILLLTITYYYLLLVTTTYFLLLLITTYCDLLLLLLTTIY